MKNLLEITNLDVSYGYGIPVLKKISMHIASGEIVALIGSNGAGKTTLMKTIIGMIKPKSGYINFKSMDVVGMESHKIISAGISHSPEGRQIFSDLTVIENLLLGAYSKNFTKAHIDESIEEIYSIFSILKERKNQIAGTLSGGEQQMLAIGRALINSPELLLLDEPSLGVSPLITQKIFDVLVKLNQQKGMAILLAEQNATLALEISDQGYVMELGKIICKGASSQLLANSLIKEAYLGI